jgi:hypothetical protein
LLAAQSNIKTYGDAFGGLGMSAHACEFYLILSGSRRAGGEVPRQRLHIGNVYLLDAQILRTELERRGTVIGVATSLRVADLRRAEVYPISGTDALFTLTDAQRQLLSLFA